MIVALVMLPLLFPGAAPARAAVGATLECTATGTVEVEQLTNFPRSPRWGWMFSGVGSCMGDGRGTWTVELSGTGISNGNGLGLCTFHPFLRWGASTTLELDSFRPGIPSVTREQRWEAPVRVLTIPVTTFPVTTPFKITEDGDPVGAGGFFTKLFARCTNPADRTDDPWAVTFAWTMLA